MHDFSAAGWLFGSILLWTILRNRTQLQDNSEFANRTIKVVLFFMNISFAGIVLFGIVRVMAYKSFEWSVEAGKGQLYLLIVKHIIFTVIFIAGLVQYMKAFKIVKKET